MNKIDLTQQYKVKVGPDDIITGPAWIFPDALKVENSSQPFIVYDRSTSLDRMIQLENKAGSRTSQFVAENIVSWAGGVPTVINPALIPAWYASPGSPGLIAPTYPLRLVKSIIPVAGYGTPACGEQISFQANTNFPSDYVRLNIYVETVGYQQQNPALPLFPQILRYTADINANPGAAKLTCGHLFSFDELFKNRDNSIITRELNANTNVYLENTLASLPGINTPAGASFIAELLGDETVVVRSIVYEFEYANTGMLFDVQLGNPDTNLWDAVIDGLAEGKAKFESNRPAMLDLGNIATKAADWLNK